MSSMKTTKPFSHRKQLAIELLLANKSKSKAWALRKAGYSEAVARQPHKVFGMLEVEREIKKNGYRGETYHQKNSPAPQKVPVIDFSKLTREKLQDLKEQLAELPYAGAQMPQAEEHSSYVPDNDWGGSIMDAQPNRSTYTRDDNGMSSI